MTRLPELKSQIFLIVKVPAHVSTPMAYTALDEMYCNFNAPHEVGGSLSSLLEAIWGGTLSTQDMYNVFEPAIFKTVDVSRQAKEKLLQLGALGAMMSGSGPAVFGVFSDEKSALEAKNALENQGYFAFLATSV